MITGGAGFIATTLARELVDRNEIIAIDNLHRDALSGTPLADHPNFTLVQCDVMDGPKLAELAKGATHFVHCAAIAGVETVLASPVRVMRVNVIGTYNALEAALGTIDTLERFVDFIVSLKFILAGMADRVMDCDSITMRQRSLGIWNARQRSS